MPKGHLFHLYTLPGAVLRFATLIPREWFYAMWFLNRYREARTTPMDASREIELHGIRPDFVPIPRPRTKMEEVLQLEEALLVIAAELHYPDLILLGRTSKSIRELIFPQGDLRIRKAKLRQVTCQPSLAVFGHCWNCNLRFCEVNEHFHPLQPTMSLPSHFITQRN
jgi:hypothetical protein